MSAPSDQGTTVNVSGEGAARDAHRLRNGIVWTAGLVLLVVLIGLAVPNLRHVYERATDASAGWLTFGVALEIGSCLGYVAVVRLVLPRGPVRPVRWLAWAEMAFGAVVPLGGAGGLAVGAWAMRAWGVSWSRIANRSAVIFMLTSAVNAAVLGIAGIGVALGWGDVNKSIWYGLVPAAIALGALAAFVSLPLFFKNTEGSGHDGWLVAVLRRTADWVKDTERVAFTPNWRVAGAIAYLVLDIAVLWACLRAVGARPPIVAVVAGYQIGYLADLIPIPGGIGVLDGGLLGALVLYGLPPAETAAAVVLYHAISLWVPCLGGTIGFIRLRGSVSAHHATASPDGVAVPPPEDPAEGSADGPNPPVPRLAA
jgi:uncharacterized membrane protein YbhN (UPF0104 family)